MSRSADLDPVAGHRRGVAQGFVKGAAARARGHRRGDRLLDIGARADQHRPVLAVDDHDVARFDPARRLGDAADDRDIEGAGDDRDMGGRRAFLEHQPLDPPVRVIQQLGRPHGVGDEDEFGRHLGGGHAGGLPGQKLLQPVGEILQIVEPLAQIGVGHLHHAALGLVAHLLHRGFGGEAAAHRLGDAPEPAAVGGEHAIGLDDVAVFAGAEAVAGVDQPVDRVLHRRRPPGAGARCSAVDILGDDLADHHPGLVQAPPGRSPGPG